MEVGLYDPERPGAQWKKACRSSQLPSSANNFFKFSSSVALSPAYRAESRYRGDRSTLTQRPESSAMAGNLTRADALRADWRIFDECAAGFYGMDS